MMTVPNRQQDLFLYAGAPAVPRRGTAGLDQVTAAGGALAPAPQDASYGFACAPQLSAHVRGEVAVVSLRGELDSPGARILRAHLSEIRRQAWARSVADLAGLTFIDSVCLGVLVRHCRHIRGRGGSFALAGPQAAVHRVLSATGLLSWFEVYDTIEEAIAGAAGHQPPGPEMAPPPGTLITTFPGAASRTLSSGPGPSPASGAADAKGSGYSSPGTCCGLIPAMDTRAAAG